MTEAAGSGAEQSLDTGVTYGVFVSEISEQCRFVLMAVGELEQLEGLDRSLNRLSARRFEEQHDSFGFPPNRSPEAVEFETISKLIELQGLGLWERLRRIRYYLDNIVDHAARIERLLWPTRTDQGRPRLLPQRGEELRRRLQVSDSSPLRASIRDLRDGWQHMDDRIERHLPGRRPSADAEDGESESSPTGLRLTRDPMVVEAQGVRLELEPVIDEVRVLLARCQLDRGIFRQPEMATFHKMQLES